MANAIVGTLILIGLGSLVRDSDRHHEPASTCPSTPARRFASLVRFAADTLNGVPSIVIGVFVYGLAVLPFKQFSALAGGLALGIMMIPIIARTTEELLLLVPGDAARRRAGARRDAGARGLHRRPAGGAAGHHHRRRAGARPHRRRDGAAALHRVQQPLLHDQARPADRLADRAGLHLRDLALRGLAPPGLGRRARARRDRLLCSLLARLATRRLERMHRA